MNTNLIPQAQPLAQYLAYREEIDAAVHRVLSAGRYILGQEVRAFAKQQNQESDAFIAAIPPRNGEGDHAQHGGGAPAPSPEEAEKGMAEMSRVYNEGGRELYIGAGDREHD